MTETATIPTLPPGAMPDSETLIRRVAAIIRERATDATSGSWGDGSDVTHGFKVAAYDPDANEHYFVAWTGDEENGDGEPTNAYADQQYIAGMQPQVALALADWLERIDEQHPASWDVGECPSCGTGHCAPHPDILGCNSCLEDYPCWPAAPAFELARRFWNGIATFTTELVPAAAESDTTAVAA